MVGNKARMSALITFIHYTGGFQQYRKAHKHKNNQKHTDFEGKNENVFLCKWHDYLENPLKSWRKKKTLGIISEFSELAGLKVNVQFYFYVLKINDWKLKLIFFKVVLKYKTLRSKLNKILHYLYTENSKILLSENKTN